MADHLIASDLSLAVLQKRQREGELRPVELDPRNRACVPSRLQPCPGQVVSHSNVGAFDVTAMFGEGQRDVRHGADRG